MITPNDLPFPLDLYKLRGGLLVLVTVEVLDRVHAEPGEWLGVHLRWYHTRRSIRGHRWERGSIRGSIRGHRWASGVVWVIMVVLHGMSENAREQEMTRRRRRRRRRRRQLKWLCWEVAPVHSHCGGGASVRSGKAPIQSNIAIFSA